MPKDFGRLGVPNLRNLNICLLASWIRRYQANNGKLWKVLIDFKYNTDRPNIFTLEIMMLPSFQRADVGS
jgi:hypothetical protein